MPRPIRVLLDTEALISNLTVVRRYAPKALVWSVIKANAYGHSINFVFQALQISDGFAVLDLNEAVFLRDKGWQGPILLLEGFFQASDLKVIDNYHLTTVIHSKWQVELLAKSIPKNTMHIYLKLNSGMNRLGFNEQELPVIWQKLHAMQQVATITLMTHFAYADQSEGIKEQMSIVKRTCVKLTIEALCLANSAAILWHPDTHYQWIRPGIILYGASPTGKWEDIATTGLRPVMTLQSKLIAIQKVSAAKHIGYGGKYCTSEDKKIGIVACGYADGYPRNAPTGTPVFVDGVYTNIIGAISMDMLVVDLQNCPFANIGSIVELWGNNIKIDEVATLSGTVGYELMSAISHRVSVQII